MGNNPSAAEIYSVITVLNVMRFPMNALPFIISMTISAAVSKKRIEDFLLSEELAQFYSNMITKSQSARKLQKKQVRFSDRINLLAEDQPEEEEMFEIGEVDETDKPLLNGSEENQTEPSSPSSPSESSPKSKAVASAGVAARISGGEFTWGTTPILTDINLEIKSGELVVVLGHVGSGKSSLLAAFLSEMQKVSLYALLSKLNRCRLPEK